MSFADFFEFTQTLHIPYAITRIFIKAINHRELFAGRAMRGRRYRERRRRANFLPGLLAFEPRTLLDLPEKMI
jgi:hypothetical protein